MIVYSVHVDANLSLVALLRAEYFDRHQGLVEWNVGVVCDGILEVLRDDGYVPT